MKPFRFLSKPFPGNRNCWLAVSTLIPGVLASSFPVAAQDPSSLASEPPLEMASAVLAGTVTTEKTLPIIDVNALTKQEFVDQHLQTHHLQFPSLRIFVLTANAEPGKDQVQGWTIPLRDAFGESIETLSVADLRTVPRFLRARMRRRFEDRWDRPVILDFTGAITELIPMDPLNVTVVVFGRAGDIIFADSGPANEAKLAEIKEAIRKKIPEAADLQEPAIQPEAVTLSEVPVPH